MVSKINFDLTCNDFYEKLKNYITTLLRKIQSCKNYNNQ